MDWQVEKEDREASMIYCLQPRRAFQLLWQSIYQRNQNILHHLHRDVLQIQITSFVFLWLNKSIKSSYVPKQVCVWACSMHTHLHTHLSHQRSGIYQIPHCNYLSMRVKCITSALWNEHYVIFSRLEVYLPDCVLQYAIYPAAWLCDPLASVLPYRLRQILSGCERLICNQQQELFLPWHGSD